MPKSAKNEWWRGAVIYQIYPRSFRDASGDGVGDIKGIIEKLDYVASLGVDAIWLSPFFKSPMKDAGYDVSDYCDVDPLFGGITDFKAMLDRAHELGLKVIIDQVLSHSSDQHAWFQESRQSRNNPKADWYVWADPNPDGTPPNNWQAVFGGPAWTYEVRRGQYYFHNFLVEQPDLNLYNAEVKKALLDACRFWLDLGVDGFRLDAIVHFFHDKKFRDNPVEPNPVPATANIDFSTPYFMQKHKYDLWTKEAQKFIREIRKMLDEYDARMAVAEVGGEDSVRVAKQFTDGPKNLHTAYNFSLISGTELSAKRIRDAVQEFEDAPGNGWASWAFSNHDVVRVASRWHPDKNGYNSDPRLSKMLIALLTTLRGSSFIYEGEELGLPEGTITFEQIQDPWGKYLYPLWQGRDGCRTPMPWEKDAPNAGFGNSPTTWLPVSPAHLPLAVDVQEADAESVLNFTRRFLTWRHAQTMLKTGAIEFIEIKDNDLLLAFIRRDTKNALLCMFNLSDQAQNIPAPAGPSTAADFDGGRLSGVAESEIISVPPYGFYFGVLE